MCSQVIDRLKMVFMPKNIVNLVMNITCVLLNLSRDLYIFECINLSIQELFLSELLQAMISRARTKKLVIPFLRIYLFASLLSVHSVSPHIRQRLRMDHQFKEDCKTVPGLKISSISPKEKYFRYLPYLSPLCPRTSNV
jgi:hypothetical protein